MPLLAGGSFNLLAVNPGLVIWTVVTFVIVLTILWLFAWKPIIKALDERNDRVKDDLEKSRQLREEAERLFKEYEDKLEAAKVEAHEIVEESRRDADAVRTRMLEEAQTESNRMKERAETDIEQAKKKALSEIESSVVDITVQVLSKVLKDEVSAEKHKEVIEKELSLIKKAG